MYFKHKRIWNKWKQHASTSGKGTLFIPPNVVVCIIHTCTHICTIDWQQNNGVCVGSSRLKEKVRSEKARRGTLLPIFRVRVQKRRRERNSGWKLISPRIDFFDGPQACVICCLFLCEQSDAVVLNPRLTVMNKKLPLCSITKQY